MKTFDNKVNLPVLQRISLFQRRVVVVVSITA